MNFYDSSFLQSSVNSYRQAEGHSNPRSREFIKFLHQKLSKPTSPYREEEYPESSPLIRRSQSQDTLNSKLISPKYIQKPNTFHNRFYESIVQSSSKNFTADFPNNQRGMTDFSAKQLILNTQNEELRKQISRLKEQIKYLTEKNETLQKNNEKLLAYKSRAQILDRQYNKLMSEYNHIRQHRGYESNYGTSPIPLTLDQMNYNYEQAPSSPNDSSGKHCSFLQSKLLKGKEVSSRIVPNDQSREYTGKINWKRVAGVSPSPIYKFQNKGKSPCISPYDQLPLIESKVDSNQEERGGYSPSYPRPKDQTRTIDIRQFQKSKSKEYQKRAQSLQQQLLDIRKKNIDLYKKYQQFEVQKLNYLETITQLKYEKTKQLTELKNKERSLQKQVEILELQKQTNTIAMLELNQQISNDSSQLNLIKLEKEELEVQLKKYKEKWQELQTEKDKQSKSKLKVQEIEAKYNRVQKEFQAVQKEMMELNKKNNQLEIEKKLLEHELNEKKESMIEMEKQINKSKPSQSINSKEVDRLDQYSNPSKNQELTLKTTQINQLRQQIFSLQQQHNINIQQRHFLEEESRVLKHENNFLRDNCERLTKIFEHQKQENLKLNELRESWRQIEKKTKQMKRIDLSVDHLWQIKEVQYENINTILGYINSQKSGRLEIDQE